MNYTKFTLKIFALLMLAQHGMVVPMHNNIPLANQPANAQPERALSPEQLAVLEQEINAIQDTLGTVLDETNAINPEELLRDMNLDQYNNKPRSNAFMPGLENFMTNMEKATEEFKKEQEWAQYQNTVLLGHPKSPVALYRRDLMELPFFAADIAIAHAFFEHIKSKRVDYIYRSLTEDTAFYIDLLTQIKETKKTLENPHDNTEENKQKLTDLLGIFAEKQSYIGNNPFKQEVVIPFLGAILGHTISRYAQEQCIVKRSFTPEAQYAYTQDQDGNYHRFEMEGSFAAPTLNDWKAKTDDAFGPAYVTQGNRYVKRQSDFDQFKSVMNAELSIFHSLLFPANAPMAATTAIKVALIPDPNADPMLGQIPEIEQFMPDTIFAKGMYKLAGLPEWLYEARNSRVARLGIEIAVLATITTQIDEVYNATWREHVEKNIDTLISLLRAHETVKQLPKDHAEKKAIQNDLVTFIQTGNTCTSWRDACGKFFLQKMIGRQNVLQKMSAWTVTAMAASLLWKSKSLFTAGFTAAKNNMLPAEAYLIGTIATIYASFLFGPITLVSASHVYQDMCWIKNKVKDAVKSFFSKENTSESNNKQADTSSAQLNENTPKEAIA